MPEGRGIHSAISMMHLSRQGDILTVIHDGQLDALGVKRIQQALSGQLNGVRHLVLDANHAEIIDTVGLAYLHVLDEKMLNRVDGTFRVVNLGESLKAAFATYDWADLLPE